MTRLSKRDILLALAALSVSAAAPALAQPACPTPDLSGGRAIGAAYLAAHPSDLASLRAELLPNGFCDAAMASLRTRAAADFRAGQTFVYRGWILSRTEGQLFALLTQA